jgi:hypothetical protein
VKGAHRVLSALSRAIPLEPPASLTSFFAPRIQAAALLASPAGFSRLFLFASIIAIGGGAATFVLVGLSTLLPVLVSLVFMELCPVLILGLRAQSRRRSVEGELPFFAMLLYILSHESSVSLVGAFEKAEQLGADIFPAISQESGRLRRNLAYSNEPEQATIERTFRFHPSITMRELVHGHLTALSSGRDVHEFAREEADRLLGAQEERWRSFSTALSSITEVSFIFLAVFPVGIQMVAGGFAGGRSSGLLALSTAALALVALALLVWMDSAQPVTRDSSLPSSQLGSLIAACGAVIVIYYLGFILVSEAAAALLAFSSIYVFVSAGYFRTLGAGEGEAAGMLHDLAELTRSGVELPRALPLLLEDTGAVRALRGPLATFAFQLSLGRTPVAAQRMISHPSWLVRISFALLAVAFETGGGFEQLERLSSSFRRVTDSKASARASVLPYVALGVAVPALSAASFWFLRSMLAQSPGFQLFTLRVAGTGAGGSILACTVLTGFLVSKAHSQSVRNAAGLPPLLASALISLLIFGSP